MSVPSEWPERFEHDPAIVYILDSDFRLSYCNAAWDRFALDNGGGPGLLRENQIGLEIMPMIPAPLKRFYSILYGRALSGEDADHVYECSSDKTLRRFHMRVQRLMPPNRAMFIAVINSLVLEQPVSEPAANYDSDTLRQENGLITMCAHCRRVQLPGVRNSGAPDWWVWVPQLVSDMPREVSHGLCTLCLEIHYGEVLKPGRYASPVID